MKASLALAAAVLVASCGGAAPPAETPATPTPPAEAAPAPTAEQKPAEAPRQVKMVKVGIEGGGIEEKDVRTALEANWPELEKCYAGALAAEPKTGGRAFVTYLYMKAERKSVSASYSGPANEIINTCLYEAAAGVKLAPAASAERVVITIELALGKGDG